MPTLYEETRAVLELLPANRLPFAMRSALPTTFFNDMAIFQAYSPTQQRFLRKLRPAARKLALTIAAQQGFTLAQHALYELFKTTRSKRVYGKPEHPGYVSTEMLLESLEV